MEEVELLKRRVDRERKARLQAEAILETKALELYKANEQLSLLNQNLEQQVKQGIEELQESEKRHRELIESVQDIIYKISPSGYFLFVNSVVQERLGYSENELIGQHFSTLVVPEFRQELIAFYRQMIEEKQQSTYKDFPALKKNGEVVWIGQTVRIIEQAGQITELVAVARDVTELKTTEDALRTTQTRLTTLITNLQKGVLVEDEYRRIILVNQLFCDLFGIPAPPDTLKGLDCSQSAEQSKHLFKNPEQFVARIEDLLLKREIVVEEELEMVDGRILQRDYIPIFLEGHYRGHLWKYADITEKHLIREQIRKSEEKYRGIMNNMELGLLEVDNDQRIVRAYDRFCKLVGYTQEELIGKLAPELLITREFEEVLNNNQALRPKGTASSYEMQILKKDGTPIWVIISGAPIMDEHGKVTGSMGIHYDITDRKVLEHELALAKQIAEDARQAEKQFLANMSHEIRTPLNAIIGMTHLLFDTRPTKQQFEFLEILKTSADFLHSLISDLLDMAKIEAGRIEVQNHPFDLVGLLRTTQRVFQIKLQNRPVELDMMIDARISGMYSGDDLMLNQILLNLIGNAEKFTEEGTIEITVKLKKEEENTLWIEFKISDTGIGIPANKLDEIFQKFKQVNANNHKHKGTGLGLAITKQLIDLQGGSISVKSREGEGTTFTFMLPFQKSDLDVVPDTFEIQKVSSDLLGCKVLVAEDNLMNQKYISSLLNKWDIDFVIASDGKKAVEKAQKQAFDIILMDIQMPNMDGYEATITIRNTKNPNQHTPIVALTASAMLDQKSKTKLVGMDDFITKPFAPNQLLGILKRYIKISNTDSNPQTSSNYTTQLDHTRLQEMYGDDKSYAADMFQTFLSNVLLEFPAIQDLILQNDWESLSKLAHKLKPTLGMVGLTKLELQLLEIETTAKENPKEEQLQKLWDDAQNSLNAAIPILQKELVQLQEPTQ
ncbi:PAS domain S-box protein [Runella limosa]|uniref:PAS domain S-box protein n=1 Tax=Runella limosa TaxID=370978 RepID=UPI0004131948|nr:PAS domain S-box protein [Runella limosa]